MNTLTSHSFRKLTLTLATTACLVVPSVASAGLFDNVRTRTQAVKTRVVTKVETIQENQPIRGALGELGGAEVIDQLKDLKIVDQLKDTVGMIRQMNAGFEDFSGGQGCSYQCDIFKTQLRTMFVDYTNLIETVPGLDGNGKLVQQLDRVSSLVEFIPPRALYMMWQSMGAKLEKVAETPDDILTMLDTLPSLQPLPRARAVSSNSVSSSQYNSACSWAAADHDYIDYVVDSLEHAAWLVSEIAGLIPEAKVGGTAGAEAGAAVANVSGEAQVEVDAADGPKTALKTISLVINEVRWQIKLNVSGAKAICKS